MNENYRLYAFVANHYLSPLQCGLQTAHVVSEIANEVANHKGEDLQTYKTFFDWAQYDKTIIICGAGNHAGVLACYDELERINSALGLPCALFREDEISMNRMATACGIVVPQKYYDAKRFGGDLYQTEVPGGNSYTTPVYWEYFDEAFGMVIKYPVTHPEGQFIEHIKSFRLA